LGLSAHGREVLWSGADAASALVVDVPQAADVPRQVGIEQADALTDLCFSPRERVNLSEDAPGAVLCGGARGRCHPVRMRARRRPDRSVDALANSAFRHDGSVRGG
jgi:hypothetical protein